MNLRTNAGDTEGLVFQPHNQPAVVIVPTLKEALIAAECDFDGDHGDRGLVLCEEHIDALRQGCVLAVQLPLGRKLYIRYKPAHPPRTW